MTKKLTAVCLLLTLLLLPACNGQPLPPETDPYASVESDPLLTTASPETTEAPESTAAPEPVDPSAEYLPQLQGYADYTELIGRYAELVKPEKKVASVKKLYTNTYDHVMGEKHHTIHPTWHISAPIYEDGSFDVILLYAFEERTLIMSEKAPYQRVEEVYHPISLQILDASSFRTPSYAEADAVFAADKLFGATYRASASGLPQYNGEGTWREIELDKQLQERGYHFAANNRLSLIEIDEKTAAVLAFNETISLSEPDNQKDVRTTSDLKIFFLDWESGKLSDAAWTCEDAGERMSQVMWGDVKDGMLRILFGCYVNGEHQYRLIEEPLPTDGVFVSKSLTSLPQEDYRPGYAGEQEAVIDGVLYRLEREKEGLYLINGQSGGRKLICRVIDDGTDVGFQNEGPTSYYFVNEDTVMYTVSGYEWVIATGFYNVRTGESVYYRDECFYVHTVADGVAYGRYFEYDRANGTREDVTVIAAVELDEPSKLTPLFKLDRYTQYSTVFASGSLLGVYDEAKSIDENNDGIFEQTWSVYTLDLTKENAEPVYHLFRLERRAGSVSMNGGRFVFTDNNRLYVLE